MKSWLKTFICIAFCTLISNQITAQYLLEIRKDSISLKTQTFSTRTAQQQSLNEQVVTLKKEGFYGIFISNDTANSMRSSITFSTRLFFTLEKIICTDSLIFRNSNQAMTLHKTMSYEELNKSIEKTLIFFENNGHPFTKINLTENTFTDSILVLNATIDIGLEVVYDSIEVKGNSKISKKFLEGFLDLKKNRKYNESEIQRISKRLSELPFLQIAKTPEVAFIGNKSRIILYLDKKNSSQFDGIVGILPQSESNNKPTVTGELKLNLQNAFNVAERIELNWKRINPLSQDLSIGSFFPYIGGSPYGTDLIFKLLKKDTSTITTTYNLGGSYFFSGMNYLKAYFEQTTSSLLGTSANIKTIQSGNNANFKTQRYGLNLNLKKVDNIWIPTTGFRIVLDANIGKRDIETSNPTTPNTTQVSTAVSTESYIRIRRRLILNLSTKTNYISGNEIYENELIKFGGLTSLRGFNEESITASFVSIANTELRWLLDSKTYLFIFWNGAYYEKRSIAKFTHDTPYGFGTGLSFDTPAGIFNITYALGREFDNPIQFKYSKIHFGIIARF